MNKEIKDRIVYVEETFAGEYETWQDPITKQLYQIPIRIERDWDNAEKL